MKPLIQLRSVCLVVALLLGGLFTQAASRPRYEVVDLGVVPGGGYPVQGRGINNAGQLTAYALASNLHYRACVFENGALRDLGVGTNGSFPRRLNEAGQIIGHFDTDWDPITKGRDHAFLYSGGNVTDLSALFGRYLAVNGMNNAGHIVGDAETDDGTSIVPFIYSNGVFQLIHLPDVQFVDVNDAGHILATINHPGPMLGEFTTRAAIYKNGRIIELRLPRRSLWSIGLFLNKRGHAIGYGAGADQLGRGFVWSKGHARTVRPLHGDTVTFLDDLNNSGEAVGHSSVPDFGSRAILWRDGRTHDLNRMISKNSGWELHAAFGLNDRGQIVGVGSFGGEYRGFLLNPIPRGHGK